jgi:hypothetical protein
MYNSMEARDASMGLQLLVDPDVIEFDSDEDEFPVLPSPPRNAATSSAALAETLQKAQANRSRFQEHNMVGSLPAFDDSDDDDALSAGHSGDDEDAGKDAAASDTDSEDSVRPFFQAVSREAKSQAKAAHSTLVNSFTNTRIGRAASLVAAKASQKVRDAVESVTSGSSGSRQNTDNSTFTASTPAAGAAAAPSKHRRIASEVEMTEMPPPASVKPPPQQQQQRQPALAPAVTPPQQLPPQLPRAASYRVAPLPAGDEASSPLQASVVHVAVVVPFRAAAAGRERSAPVPEHGTAQKALCFRHREHATRCAAAGGHAASRGRPKPRHGRSADVASPHLIDEDERAESRFRTRLPQSCPPALCHSSPNQHPSLLPVEQTLPSQRTNETYNRRSPLRGARNPRHAILAPASAELVHVEPHLNTSTPRYVEGDLVCSNGMLSLL